MKRITITGWLDDQSAKWIQEELRVFVDKVIETAELADCDIVTPAGIITLDVSMKVSGCSENKKGSLEAQKTVVVSVENLEVSIDSPGDVAELVEQAKKIKEVGEIKEEK